MATSYIYYDDIAAGIRITNDTYNSDYVIDVGAILASTDSTAIDLKGTSSDIYVRGTVAGSSYGIRLGDDTTGDWGNSVRIAEGGAVLGQTAVSIRGSGVLANKGDIDANGYGVFFDMAGSSSATITNEGTISAGTIGVYGSAYGTSSMTMVNRGVITANFGVYFGGDSGSSSRITNYGTIEGHSYAFLSGSGTDRLTNQGRMLGTVDLGSGNDSYDGRGGRIEGTVYGSYGDDTFLAGTGAEDFDGGSGIDTLDFRGSAGLRVSLDDDAGTGLAEGDSYVGFERILGSRSGGDRLIGDDLANTLQGFGGVDLLQGGGGDDVLAGGHEADRLAGGLGNDVFLFTRPREGGDLVLDFKNVVGDNDVFHIAVAGFGGGLVAGALAPTQLVTRADNLAQDADDRFVFRTTDKTLWFDVDGKGGAAAVMLADLGASVVLTSADILLV